LPQFDIISNYYVIQIFSIFFFACYILMIIALNGIFKFVNLPKVEKIKNNMFYSSGNMLILMSKLKKFWYLKNFKK